MSWQHRSTEGRRRVAAAVPAIDVSDLTRLAVAEHSRPAGRGYHAHGNAASFTGGASRDRDRASATARVAGVSRFIGLVLDYKAGKLSRPRSAGARERGRSQGEAPFGAPPPQEAARGGRRNGEGEAPLAMQQPTAVMRPPEPEQSRSGRRPRPPQVQRPFRARVVTLHASDVLAGGCVEGGASPRPPSLRAGQATSTATKGPRAGVRAGGSDNRSQLPPAGAAVVSTPAGAHGAHQASHAAATCLSVVSCRTTLEARPFAEGRGPQLEPSRSAADGGDVAAHPTPARTPPPAPRAPSAGPPGLDASLPVGGDGSVGTHPWWSLAEDGGSPCRSDLVGGEPEQQPSSLGVAWRARDPGRQQPRPGGAQLAAPRPSAMSDEAAAPRFPLPELLPAVSEVPPTPMPPAQLLQHAIPAAPAAARRSVRVASLDLQCAGGASEGGSVATGSLPVRPDRASQARRAAGVRLRAHRPPAGSDESVRLLSVGRGELVTYAGAGSRLAQVEALVAANDPDRLAAAAAAAASGPPLTCPPDLQAHARSAVALALLAAGPHDLAFAAPSVAPPPPPNLWLDVQPGAGQEHGRAATEVPPADGHRLAAPPATVDPAAAAAATARPLAFPSALHARVFGSAYAFAFAHAHPGQRAASPFRPLWVLPATPDGARGRLGPDPEAVIPSLASSGATATAAWAGVAAARHAASLPVGSRARAEARIRQWAHHREQMQRLRARHAAADAPSALALMEVAGDGARLAASHARSEKLLQLLRHAAGHRGGGGEASRARGAPAVREVCAPGSVRASSLPGLTLLPPLSSSFPSPHPR